MTLLFLHLEHAPHHDVSWWRDDFLPWLVGISTAVGVVAAILAGIFAALAYRREVLRDNARDDELRDLREKETRSHASLVALWTDKKHHYRRETPIVSIRNASELPMYDCELYWYNTENPTFSNAEIGWLQPLGTLPPESLITRRLSDDQPELADAAVEKLSAPTRGNDRMPYPVSVAITFSDAAWIRWIRYSDGRLERVHPANRITQPRD